jgi:N-acetylglutamate synthase
MVSWPELGTRVAVRYRRPEGSFPPLTDIIGHLLDITPLVRVQPKTGDVVRFSPDDVVAVRPLSDNPVRASEIRVLEYADAMAWPNIERQWLDGWLLRAGPDAADYDANSAVPLERSANQLAIPAIVDWYRSRHLTPRLAIPDRLLRLPDQGEQANWMLVRNVEPADADRAADGPAAITDAPDGTRWVGLSAVRTATPDEGVKVCEALLAWGGARGATRGYVRVRDDDHVVAALAQSLGFALHHRAHYVTV